MFQKSGIMVFENRTQAGQLLAKRLASFKFDPKKTVVFGIPRGGVPVAYEASKFLKIPLEVIVVKKLGAPGNPELAIGATGSHGEPVLDRWLIADLGVTAQYIKKEVLKKKKEAKSLERILGIEFGKAKYGGKTAILVDDGLATGQTVKAAGKILKELGTDRIILAVPCGFDDILLQIKDNFDDVVFLVSEKYGGAVGQFYRDFGQVSTEQVKEILNETNRRVR